MDPKEAHAHNYHIQILPKPNAKSQRETHKYLSEISHSLPLSPETCFHQTSPTDAISILSRCHLLLPDSQVLPASVLLPYSPISFVENKVHILPSHLTTDSRGFVGLNSLALGFNVDFFTCSATGPSSLSSPLMRPTGGLPVWLGQGGGG